MTVQGQDEDKVKALDLGADDYLTKPFSMTELLARIRVALRHSVGMNNLESNELIFRTAILEVDLVGHITKVNNSLVHLSLTEFNILKILIKHAGKVVTHKMLLKEVLGPNSTEHTQYLRVYLNQIRKKLRINDNTPEIISTEPGVGYRLLTTIALKSNEIKSN